MKKALPMSLAVLLALPAGANAGTENPLYAPETGHTYSITDIYGTKDGTKAESHSRSYTGIKETIGYGFTDRFQARTTFGYANKKKKEAFGEAIQEAGFDDLALGISYKYLDGNTIGYLYGEYGTNLEKKTSDYGKHNSYTIGTKIGTAKDKHTIAGRFEYRYLDPKNSSGEDGANQFAVGLAGLYGFTPKFSGLLDIEYKYLDMKDGATGDKIDNPVYITAQLNYDIGGTLSGYYKTDAASKDEYADEDVYGLKYGVQF